MSLFASQNSEFISFGPVDSMLCYTDYQDIVFSTVGCHCCQRHQTKRPTMDEFHSFFDGNYPDSENSSDCNCGCDCRLVARMACRENVKHMNFVRKIIDFNVDVIETVSSLDEANIEPPFDGDKESYFILNDDDIIHRDNNGKITDVKERIVYHAYVEGCVYKLVVEKDITDVDIGDDDDDDDDDDESIINGYRLVSGLRVYMHQT
jgi:hypothetical protein